MSSALNSVHEAVSVILNEAKATNVPIDPLKLQKLLFYSYAHYQSKHHEALFPEQIEPWKHGPVVRDVYHRFKSFQWNPISSEFTYPEIEIKALESICLVSALFFPHSSADLADMSHEHDAYKNSLATSSSSISPEDIRREFENHSIAKSPILTYNRKKNVLFSQNILIGNDSVEQAARDYPWLTKCVNNLCEQTLLQFPSSRFSIYNYSEEGETPPFISLIVACESYPPGFREALDNIMDTQYDPKSDEQRSVNLTTIYSPDIALHN